MMTDAHHPKAIVDVDQTNDSRLDLAGSTLPRRKFFDDMPDKGLFAVAAVVGFIGIILLKLYTPLHSSFVAAMAVGIMLLYGLIAFRLPAIQMRPDRLGDNFYYLGFIYTLASLSAALFQLQYDPRFEELLGNFGIALVTTVVGVAGRVLFVQMRGELDEVEQHVRRDLASASADLRAQLTSALREFETFHTGVLQSLAEASERSSETTRAHLEKLAQVAERAVSDVDHRAQAVSGPTERLAMTVDRLNAAIADLPALRDFELPGERLQSQIAHFTSELEQLVLQLRDATASAQHLAGRRWFWPFRRRRS